MRTDSLPELELRGIEQHGLSTADCTPHHVRYLALSKNNCMESKNSDNSCVESEGNKNT